MGKPNQSTIDEEVIFGREEELVGKNHNIVRHPDMPKKAFADIWSKLQSEQAWRGAVKIRCKDGRYYWVNAFVTPVYDKGQLSGYQSVRTVLKPEFRANAETLYRIINNGKFRGDGLRAKSGVNETSSFNLEQAFVVEKESEMIENRSAALASLGLAFGH